MIKLSTKGRYGSRLMLALARHLAQGKKSVTLKEIAEEEDISLRYLEQIVMPLKMANLLKSIRGAGGGYTLARKPSQIKLLDILEAMEGPCALVNCVLDKNFCDRLPSCAAYVIWKEASAVMENYLSQVTLQYMLDICETKKTPKKKTAR